MRAVNFKSAGGANLYNRKRGSVAIRGSIAHRLLYSTSGCPGMTEMLFKGRKLASHSSIH